MLFGSFWRTGVSSGQKQIEAGAEMEYSREKSSGKFKLKVNQMRVVFALLGILVVTTGFSCTRTPKGEKAEYQPCGGKECGEACKVCEPGDANCVETMVMKTCNSSGECSADSSQCSQKGSP